MSNYKKMPRRCKECPDGKIETKEIEIKKEKRVDGLKRFNFPRLGRSVLAKDLLEAEKLVKAIKEDEKETK